MRKTSYVIAGLAVALVGTNAFWLYKTIDSAVSYSYLNDSYRAARSSAQQAFAVLPVAARPGSSQADVVAAAVRAGDVAEPFEKDGYTWVGDIGLKFGSDGPVVDAMPGVDPL
jgi:hypothetical protein